ncbi:hypothetical protein KIL84_009804 [Mauremys mutica]|uniref:Uncharacterized protein n=1 Tax=Mauremys mutica TaxID=74926 RepID=A0A9D3XMZ3_9SAUR|nr:hypothetical protein KIL84_009804 [Mauremys mutica]
MHGAHSASNSPAHQDAAAPEMCHAQKHPPGSCKPQLLRRNLHKKQVHESPWPPPVWGPAVAMAGCPGAAAACCQPACCVLQKMLGPFRALTSWFAGGPEQIPDTHGLCNGMKRERDSPVLYKSPGNQSPPSPAAAPPVGKLKAQPG